MKTRKILLIALGIILFYGVILVFVRGSDQSGMGVSVQETEYIPVVPTDQTNARLLLYPSVSSMAVGRSIEMEVMIDAPDVTLDGADAIVTYDPTMVQVGAVVNATANSDVSRGPYFHQIVRATVDEEQGKIMVTGFSPRESQPQKKGTDPVTAFSFPVTGLRPGVALFHIENEPGRSDLSTLVEKGTSKNILTGTGNAEITIRNE